MHLFQSVFMLAITMALLAPTVDAWWCLGHMLVGHIAHKTTLPSVATQLSSVINDFGSCGKFPLTPDVMQVGCWADDIKAMGLYTMTAWHYYDIPYNPNNITIPAVCGDNVVDTTDGFMRAAKAQQNSWVLSFALANLIHFFGDIHQPMHAISLYNEQFPDGDQGGNLIRVNVNNQWTNLHAVWDSICGKYNDPPRPLSSSDRAFVDSLADTLLRTYTFSETDAKLWNTTAMALESNAAAIKYAYAGVNNDDYLSVDYIERCSTIAEARITLAGLRLGNELNYLFSTMAPHEVPRAILKRIEKHHRSLLQHGARRRRRS